MPLETKVPPPVVAAVAASIMLAISRLAPQLALPLAVRWGIAVILLMLGLAVSIAGVLVFRRARTTLNPTRPDEASALVSSGIYQMTRNPMYLGLLLVLAGWSALLASVWALWIVAGFVLYMNRFQIKPEERVLSQLFGDEYTAYKARVRRWL